MIKHDKTHRRISIDNNTLRMLIDYSNGVAISELSNIKSGGKQNINQELFLLSAYGKKFCSKDFIVKDVCTATDNQLELLTILLELPEEGFAVRFHVINDKLDCLTILYQITDSYKLGVPYVSKIHYPWLANMEIGDNCRKFYPASPLKTPYGKDVVIPMRESFYSTDVLLPLVICDEKGKYGFSVSFPVSSDLSDTGAVQNINIDFAKIADEQSLKCHEFCINPDKNFSDTTEIKIVGLEDGWPEAFDRCREIWTRNYDFSEYDREDLKWFNDCVVHNFTFLYSHEALDESSQSIDVERIVESGKAFGGFDTITFWNQYPRLGIDGRNQWDFYNDFPGGRFAIRKAIKDLHDNGIFVFMPYIPWDQGTDESAMSMGDKFATLIADTDADGYHLDTMKDLPFSFREKLENVKPGIVLTTQSHPLKKHPTEFITTSWDEFWYTNPMPEIDIFRFMNPRHISPVISRWLRKEDKDILINRAKFGAAPIVIWEDVFGRRMPFSDAQKQAIAEWKAAYLKYKEIYQGLRPIPIYPTQIENLYCNVFTDNSDRRQIYSLYNDSDNNIYCELPLFNFKAYSVENILGDSSARLFNNKLAFNISPREVVHILVY